MTECKQISTEPLGSLGETALWALYHRALAARQLTTGFHDGLAIRMIEQIDYPFQRNFGKFDSSFVERAIATDQIIREWLELNPTGVVIALAEGLETQFCRVDNGRVYWISIDLPEILAIRERFIPTHERHRNFSCSVTDFKWIEEVRVAPEKQTPILITAIGLLYYLQPVQVRRIITAIAENFPGAEVIFDTVPLWIGRRSLRCWKKTAYFKVPPMPWSIGHSEIPSIKTWHKRIESMQIHPLVGGSDALQSRLATGRIDLEKVFCLVRLVLAENCRPSHPA